MDQNAKDLGALMEALRNIERSMEKLEEHGKQTTQKVESIDRKVDHVDWRVQIVEQKLAAMSKTTEEFDTLKNQAQGAGKALSVFRAVALCIMSSIGTGVLVWGWFWSKFAMTGN